MRRIILLISIFAASTLAAAPAPTPAEFLGYEIGARFTPHHRIVAYFEALEEARPDRVELISFGETWEGRPLLTAVIASEENLGRLDAIRAAARSLADPRGTTRDEAERIAAEMPAIVWLAFGVHGDESSSAEAAMLVASRLMAGDESVASLLENLVVVIDPLQNPDGRERYVQWFESRVGRESNPDAQAIEHDQPWPGGRYNHYLVDMNRDWMWATQRESQARVRAYLEWQPQVFVDFHEMGYDSTYFFPPDADPINTNIDPETERWLEEFGTANAEAFSSRGWPFFVGEYFDLFYPGYGDSWPSLRGAIGMTYEMAGHGMAGRAIRRDDGTVLTLADRAERHFTAAMATLATAADSRDDLLLHTFEVFERQYRAPHRTYLLDADSPQLDDAITILRRQQIEISLLTEPVRLTAAPHGETEAAPVEFEAGTVVVTTRQPLGALVRTLFERSPEIDPEFLERQRERVEADEPDEFYDITAWALPLALNLRAWSTDERVPEARLRAWAPRPAPAPAEDARFGWLVDGRDPHLYGFIGELMRRDVNFSVVSEELTHGARTGARGTILVQRHNNGDDILVQVRGAAGEVPARVVAIDDAWRGGLALGSGRVVHVRDPRIAIAAGPGTTPTSLGDLWYAFDRTVRIPHTLLPLDGLDSADLSRYRVLVFPDGNGYARALQGDGGAHLKAWIEQGGTLVAIRRAARALRAEKVGISSTKLWEPPKPEEGKEAEEPKRHNEFQVPGAAFRTVMNQRSFLTFGLASSPAVLVAGSDVLLPVPYAVDNVITIPKDGPLAAGFAWPESIERLQGSSWLVVEHVGRGKVITFAGEPNFRSFWRGTLPLLLNAALYGPSFE